MAVALLCTGLACAVSVPVFPAPSPSPSPTATIVPSPAPPAGQIVYVGSDRNIYVIDREGQHKSAVTQDAALLPAAGQVPRVYLFPTWAPDGQHLAYLSFSRPDSSGFEASLYTSLADGSGRVSIFNSRDASPFYLFWSPDSQSVSFLSNGPGGNGEIELNLAPAAGGGNRVIDSGQPYYWDWSPDNRALLIHTGGAIAENPFARLALLNLDGSAQPQDLGLKPGFFQAPAWSPDGQDLALTIQTESGEGQLVLAGQDGQVKRVLTTLIGPAAFAWAPPGSGGRPGGRLAYTTLVRDDAGPAVRLVWLDLAEPDRLTEAARGDVIAFFWSPDGKKIAYFSLEGDKPGVTARAVSRVAQTPPVVHMTASVYDLAAGESKQVAAFVPTTSFLQVFPYFDQYQRSGTLWSPDSQHLVLAVITAEGEDAIYVASADGSQYRKIADGDLAFWSWK